MDKNILILSTQYPHCGGAATFAYDLHNYLQKNNINSKCIFFVNNIISEKLLDPYKYGNIYMFKRNEINKYLNKLKTILENIDCIFAINYGVISIIKNLFNKKIIYISTGSPELTLGEDCPINNNISYMKYMNDNNNNFKIIRNNKNYKSIVDSSFTIIGTNDSKNLYHKIFPELINKMQVIFSLELLINIDKFNLNKKISYNNLDKKIDLIAIASSWDRKVKNVKLLYNIFQKYPKFNKVIIGKSSLYNFNEIENTIFIENIANYKVLEYLKNSKIIIIPSFFESACITLVEGLSQKCKIITSKNVGLSYLLPDEYICNDIYDINEWILNIDKIYKVNNLEYNIPDYSKINIFQDIFKL